MYQYTAARDPCEKAQVSQLDFQAHLDPPPTHRLCLLLVTVVSNISLLAVFRLH